MKEKIFIALCGFPQSGKTTAANKIKEVFEDVAVCDDDEILEKNWDTRQDWMLNFFIKEDKSINVFNIYFLYEETFLNFMQIFKEKFKTEVRFICLTFSPPLKENIIKKNYFLLEKIGKTFEQVVQESTMDLKRFYKFFNNNIYFLHFFDEKTLILDINEFINKSIDDLEKESYRKFLKIEEFKKEKGLEKYNSKEAEAIIYYTKKQKGWKVASTLEDELKKQFQEDTDFST